MGKETTIQWCDSTVNPTGFQCDGCELWQPRKGIKICYAGRWAERIGGLGAFDQPIQLKPGRVAEAAKWSDLRGVVRNDKPWIPSIMPRLIFVGDMADTFSTGVPYEYLKNEVVQVIRSSKHIGLWLTKRPKLMAEFSTWIHAQFGCEWPDNLWAGTSVTTPERIFRIDQLYDVGNENTKRFVSFEPLLGQTDWTDLKRKLRNWKTTKLFHWAIIGGDSAPYPKPFDLAGASELIKILTDAGIEVFVKQLGAAPYHTPETVPGYFLPLKDKKGGDWNEWPSHFRIRNFPL
jgi:protein gp37